MYYVKLYKNSKTWHLWPGWTTIYTLCGLKPVAFEYGMTPAVWGDAIERHNRFHPSWPLCKTCAKIEAERLK